MNLSQIHGWQSQCRGVGIAIDEAAGTATVELLDAPRAEGEPKIEPAHPASTTRH